MERLFASGHVVDLVLGVMVLEVGALLVYRHQSQRGLSAAQLLSVMVPGICLLLALRGALVGAAAPIIAAWLSAALVAHITDVAFRMTSS